MTTFVETINVYEVRTDKKYDAVFSHVKEDARSKGDTLEERVTSLIAGEWEKIKPSAKQPGKGAKHERLLDIVLTPGRSLYLIYLNADEHPNANNAHNSKANKNTLFFVNGNAILQVGLEGTRWHGLIEEPKTYGDPTKGLLWASFIVDTMNMPAEKAVPEADAHLRKMRIPFIYNLRDHYGNPPYIYEPHSQVKEKPRTHGGAHPPIGSFLVLEGS